MPSAATDINLDRLAGLDWAPQCEVTMVCICGQCPNAGERCPYPAVWCCWVVDCPCTPSGCGGHLWCDDCRTAMTTGRAGYEQVKITREVRL